MTCVTGTSTPIWLVVCWSGYDGVLNEMNRLENLVTTRSVYSSSESAVMEAERLNAIGRACYQTFEVPLLRNVDSKERAVIRQEAAEGSFSDSTVDTRNAAEMGQAHSDASVVQESHLAGRLAVVSTWHGPLNGAAGRAPAWTSLEVVAAFETEKEAADCAGRLNATGPVRSFVTWARDRRN
jgi:hypothetical protein